MYTTFKMKKVSVNPVVDPKQQNIQFLFGVKKPTQTTTSKPSSTSTPIPGLASDDALVQAFYDSLGEKERAAHIIAVEKLGTSYDVRRTHGFLAWKKRCA